MSAATGVLHPKCGKRFANGGRIGHCAACCETFVGLGAFDRHQAVTDGVVTCADLGVDQYNEKGRLEPWWQDAQERWHYGERMTDEQKRKAGWL